jgi:hypothetical protein
MRLTFTYIIKPNKKTIKEIVKNKEKKKKKINILKVFYH